jgi:hypothetical protein
MIILLCGIVDALFADFEVAIYVITARFRKSKPQRESARGPSILTHSKYTGLKPTIYDKTEYVSLYQDVFMEIYTLKLDSIEGELDKDLFR